MATESSNPLTAEGLILGASAAAGGDNVAQRLAALLALAPISGPVVADLGCGVGAYSEAIAALPGVRALILVDIVPGNVAAATARVAGKLAVESHISGLERLPLGDGCADAVVIIEVLDHVADVAASLREAYRILRPGGTLHIAVPNRLFPFETHPVKWRGQLMPPQYFPFLPWIAPLHTRLSTARVFSARGMRRLLREAGFEAPRTGYLLPPLEHSRRLAFLRPLMRALRNTPLACFGVSLCMATAKPRG